MDLFNSGLHHEVTSSSWERYNPDSLWQVIQDNILCGNNRGDVSGRFGEIV